MDNNLGDEDSPYFLHSLQNKRYPALEDLEEDSLAKRTKMTQNTSYNYMNNPSPMQTQHPQQSANSTLDHPLPLMHPHPNAGQHTHYSSMSQNPSAYSQSYYGSNMGYPGTYSPSSSNSQGNSSASTFNFPFLTGLPPPNTATAPSSMQSQYGNSSMNQGSSIDPSYRYPSSPMAPPASQVFYFSSPPYVARQSTYPHITSLQQPNHQYQSPLTSMLHDQSLDPDPQSFDPSSMGLNNPGFYKYGGALNTLANLASVNDNSNSSLDEYTYQETKIKKKTKVIENGVLKKKEGLEESSIRILNLLQQRGKIIFKEIHETLGIDYRRAYDILNILLTTSLITKTGKKRENKMPFVYQDGTPLEETVDIRDILNEIRREEETNRALQQRVAVLEQELEKEEPNLKLVSQLQDVDPVVSNDPLYKDLFKQIST